MVVIVNNLFSLLSKRVCYKSPKTSALLIRPAQRCTASKCGGEEKVDNPFRKNLEDQTEIELKKYKPIVSMWGNPDCCAPCIEDVVRHDILYLKETPKKYTRTWPKCDEYVKMVYKCDGEIEPPEIERRQLRRTKVTAGGTKACEGDESKLNLMKCRRARVVRGLCPKVPSPNCKAVRDPPYCSKVVIHECCQKRCTLYPAYSECKRPKPKALRPTECRCTKIPPICEIYEKFRKFALK